MNAPPLRRLFDPAATDDEIRAHVEALAQWACRGCGALLATRKAPLPGDALCFGCSKPAPRPPTREEALRACGVPTRFAREAWKPLLRPPHPHGRPDWHLRDWKGDPWCLVLSGGSDRGKTMLSVELLFRLLPKFLGGAWRSASAIEEKIKLFNDNPLQVEMAKACRAPLLVIDDYGKGAGRAGGRDGVDGVLKLRHEEMLTTILTTNLTPSELLALDGGIGRRIVTDGVAVPVAGDWRLNVAKG